MKEKSLKEMKIQDLKFCISRLETDLKERKEELKYLEQCKQIKPFELIERINDFISVETKEGSYEHILGGDGRSRPYSEQREGLISIVTFKEKIYLTDQIKGLIIHFVKDKFESDSVKFELC